MYRWQQVKDNTNLLCSTVRQIPFFSGFPIFSDYIIPEVNKYQHSASGYEQEF